MAGLVYVLCAATSLLCACLLLRAHRAHPHGVLFWSGLCFAFLTLNNVLLVADRLIVPETDLSTARLLPALAAVVVLVHGLIAHAD